MNIQTIYDETQIRHMHANVSRNAFQHEISNTHDIYIYIFIYLFIYLYLCLHNLHDANRLANIHMHNHIGTCAHIPWYPVDMPHPIAQICVCHFYDKLGNLIPPPKKKCQGIHLSGCYYHQVCHIN